MKHRYTLFVEFETERTLTEEEMDSVQCLLDYKTFDGESSAKTKVTGVRLESRQHDA